MPEALSVSRGAFDRAFEDLLANFDPYYPAEKLDDLMALYRRVFTDSAHRDGPTQDALLERAVSWIIDHRVERGMPRVAELRTIVDELLDADRMDRQGRAMIEKRLAAEAQIRRIREQRNGR